MYAFIKPKRKVHTVFIHCSASDDEKLIGKKLYNWVKRIHVNQRNWSDIGYHIMIDKKGNIMEGRPLENRPAAQKGHNTGTIAIMVHGLEDFTPVSLDALKVLCSVINDLYGDSLKFRGHREVANKTCPVFDYKKVLNLDKAGFVKKTKKIEINTKKESSLWNSLVSLIRKILGIGS